MICKKCEKKFHYCCSCSTEYCCDQGYCSDICLEESDEYKKKVEYLNNLTENELKILSKFEELFGFDIEYYPLYEILENRMKEIDHELNY